MYGYIYETTNLINGKKYIGQKKYDKNNYNYLGSGLALKAAIKKYGKENFKKEILCECNSLDELNQKEIYFITLFNAVISTEYYNLTYGGSGLRRPRSEKEKKKMSEFMQGENNPRFGKHLSEETKKKISKKLKGIFKHTEESKKKMSEIKTGKNNNFYGKKHTEESLNKMREVHKGQWTGNKNPNFGKNFTDKNNPFYGKHHTEEFKKWKSEQLKGQWSGEKNPKARSIEYNGIVYSTIKEAAEANNIKPCILWARLHRKRKKEKFLMKQIS